MGTFNYDDENESIATMEEEFSVQVSDDDPFHVLLLGDFSGMTSKADEIPSSSLSQRRPVEIDRDSFDDVMKKLKVGLWLNFDDNSFLNLRFTELEDFHPDRIFQQVPLFAKLRDTRRGLLNPNTFELTAKEVRGWAGVEKQEEAPEPIAERALPADDLLAQLLSEAQTAKPQQTKPREMTEISALISDAVKPFLVKTDEAEQSRLVSAVDEATSELMRKILHHPHFQALESAWRAVYLLVRRVDTDEDTKLFLLDATKDEIARDLKSAGDLSKTALYKWLIEDAIETPGATAWSVVCADYGFQPVVDDVAMLIRVGKMAQASGTPFIAKGCHSILGAESFEKLSDSDEWNLSEDSNETKLWNTLRSMPESAYLGLAIPRFLTRLPYGTDTDPTESFSFEEFTEGNNHENYCWANPSFVCGMLLAQSFSSFGWDMENGLLQDIDGLPMHFFNEDGETKPKPCAETVMTLKTAEKILEEGLMPLLSFKDSDRVRLGRFQSIAHPSKPLRGRWNV